MNIGINGEKLYIGIKAKIVQIRAVVLEMYSVSDSPKLI